MWILEIQKVQLGILKEDLEYKIYIKNMFN